MDINDAIDRFYLPLSVTQYKTLVEEFGTAAPSLAPNIINNDEGYELDVYVNTRVKLRIFLMVRNQNGNTFTNVVAKISAYRTNESINSIALNLGANNQVFNPEFRLGDNAYLYEHNPGGNPILRNVQYLANVYEPFGTFGLFIILRPSETMNEMITNQLENVELMRRQGHNINIPSMRIMADIRIRQSTQPINNGPEDIPRNDILDRTRETDENIRFYTEETRTIEAQDMGENIIVRSENVVNAVEPEEELEIILSTTPNIAGINDATNSLIDLMVAQLVAKGDPQDFADAIFQGEPVPFSLLQRAYNTAMPYLGALLPRIYPPLGNRSKYYSILSVVSAVSLIPIAVLYWNIDMLGRIKEANQEYAQLVLNDDVVINNSQDVVDTYIKYIQVTSKLNMDDKNLLSPLLENTVVYHVQDGQSYVSFPETFQSLDNNGVKLDPYFPEKYASNLPTPNPSSTARYTPTETISISPSASLQPSATPRFTPGREYNMGDKYEPTIVEQALDVITGETSVLSNMSWVGSVLPILGSLISNGLSVLTSVATSGISILSYVLIAGLAVGAYLFTRNK